jgi:hypothetical protein
MKEEKGDLKEMKEERHATKSENQKGFSRKKGQEVNRKK